METPVAVANFFLRKSFETGVPVTPMKLVKLVYIAHGWHLGIKSEPLLSEVTQAWKYGPVIPSVYHSFKKYGNSQVTSLELDLSTMTYPEVTDPETITFLNKIWDVYSKFSGLQLSTMTHQDNTPWSNIWHQKGGKNAQSVPIPDDLIEKHYKDKIASVNE